MSPRLLRSGSRAVLVEVEGLEAVRALHRHLRGALEADELPGVIDLVPASRTLLVVFDHEEALAGARGRLEELATQEHSRVDDHGELEVVTVPAVFDGEDLRDVADHYGLSPEALVERVTSEEWSVAFAGFAPGFGYCTGGEHVWDTPRRSEPRTRVPAGSVALAGEYAAVYPQDSPGGWQLIGHTDLELFDPDRQPPALFRAGVRIRFEEVSR